MPNPAPSSKPTLESPQGVVSLLLRDTLTRNSLLVTAPDHFNIRLLPDLSSLTSLLMALDPQATRATLKLLRDEGSLAPPNSVTCLHHGLEGMLLDLHPSASGLAPPTKGGVQLTGAGRRQSTTIHITTLPMSPTPTLPVLVPLHSKSHT